MSTVVRRLGAGALLALVLPLLPAPGQASAPPLIAREGSGTSPVKPGIDPARDLRSASFRLDVNAGTARSQVYLGAQATAATASDLWVAFGTLNGANCDFGPSTAVSAPTTTTAGTIRQPDGSLVYEIGNLPDPEALNCAVAITVPTGGTPSGTVYDALTVPLSDVLAPAVAELEAAVHEDDYAVYANRWTPVRVVVRNPGTGPATGVRVSIGGAGVKSTKAISLGTIAAGQRKVAKIRVRAKGGKRIKGGLRERVLRMTVTGNGPAAINRQIDTTTMVLPKGGKPRAGRYAGNRLSFRAKGRTVRGLTMRYTAVCTGGVNYSETLRLPTTKINKYGWVNRWYTLGKGSTKSSVLLRMRFKGTKVTHGFLSYRSGPCRGTRDFKAKRVKR